MLEHFYLTDVLILLAVVVFVVPLFQRLRLGTVLGFLASGAVVGPWGFGFIDEVEEIRHLAEFGVVFLLFVIGIEMKPSRLWVMRRSVFGLGTAQVLVTGLLISLAALAFGLPESTALVVGFGLALSSTAFGLQLLSEKGDLRREYGRSAFAILLFQDLAVVPLVALVPLLADQDLSLARDLELVALETVLILLGVLLVGRLLLRPLLNLMAGIRTPEIFVATALLLVLGASWLTEKAGLSMALGAFLAGMLLSDSRYRHQIMVDIQPFRGLLLGLFFMTVGMSIDFGLLGRQGPQVAALVGGLLLLKAALLWFLCRVTGRSHGEAVHVALLLAQGGEFAFVLFGLAYAVGVMPMELYQLLLLVVAVSMGLTALLFKMAPLLGQLPATTGPKRGPGAEQIPASRDHVIVAGFGRFGQRVAHVLSKAGLNFRALDNDPARVTHGRAHGDSVYFGDASRIDILGAAGAADAALVVFTVDNMETIAQGAAALRDAYPQLPIYARASDSLAARRLRNIGVDQVVPETLEAALQLSSEVLRASGIESATAARLIDGFRQQEYDSLGKVIPDIKHQPFTDILLVLPSAGEAIVLLERTAALAQANKARLTVADAVGALPDNSQQAVEGRSPRGSPEPDPEHCRQRLDELVAPLREHMNVDVAVLTGTAHIAIIREVLRSGHDLVVKARQPGRGIRDRLFPDTDMQLLRRCPCPVWFVRPEEIKPYRRVVAAVDVDYHETTHRQAKLALNRHVLELAVPLAVFELSELLVVNVWQAYGEDALRSGRSPFPQRDTDAYVEREQKRHLDALQQLFAEVHPSVGSKTTQSVKPSMHLVNGDPRVEIIRLARNQDVDLLVIGNAGRTGIPGFMQINTAEAIFSGLECSVLVDKPPEFVTSITVED